MKPLFFSVFLVSCLILMAWKAQSQSMHANNATHHSTKNHPNQAANNFSSKPASSPTLVSTENGLLEGRSQASGIHSFKGIPFAQPPLGELRWKAPQPAQDWEGVRKADKFGPRPMQRAIFGDMNFRSEGMSEDCLYLNVWTPAKSSEERLPVLVYFYGGGFMAGDGSEPRYDGESMALKGIVTLTVNYRLGVFGFLAHPALSKESIHNASGNYGLLDQQAALRWVQRNIAAFGGDPQRVTIAGESAGSYSVSAQMASPLSKNLMAAAIGQSGSLLSLQPLPDLAEAEKMGLAFAKSIEGAQKKSSSAKKAHAANASSALAALRAIPAGQLLEATARPGTPRFSAIVDGYFFPKDPAAIFRDSAQAKVPLLAGWNSEERNYRAILGEQQATAENYQKAIYKLYPEQGEEILKLYPGTNQEEVMQSATDLAGDRFIGYSTWKWLDIHAQTSGKPVYRYFYARARPPMTPEMGDATAGLAGGIVRKKDQPDKASSDDTKAADDLVVVEDAQDAKKPGEPSKMAVATEEGAVATEKAGGSKSAEGDENTSAEGDEKKKSMAAPAPRPGAVHSAEIEYALGNLSTNKVFAWEPEDYLVSEIMQGYFANFIISGDPNVSTNSAQAPIDNRLPNWPPSYSTDPVQFMYINVNPHLQAEAQRARYLLLEKLK